MTRSPTAREACRRWPTAISSSGGASDAVLLGVRSGGRLLFDAGLPVDDGSYRVFLYPWSATPPTRPVAVAAAPPGGRLSVYASWNGASTVARWQVLAGGRAVAAAADTSFETRIDFSSTAATFSARALSATGKVLATSARVHPS